MDDRLAERNRRITGTLLAIRNAPAGEYDINRFFDDRINDFIETPRAAAFALLLAAKLVGESAKASRSFKPNEFISLGLPAAAERDPNILAGFRLTVVLMNNDLAIAHAMVDTIVQSSSRSRDVLACLLGLLTEAPPPER